MSPDHITLLVTSLDCSMPYYEALLPLLGFEKQRDHVFASESGFVFQFGQAKTGTAPYERYGAGMNHLGFGAESPAAVHAIRDAMTEAGFDVPALQNLGGATALFMKDPDGIRIEITHYPPGQSIVD